MTMDDVSAAPAMGAASGEVPDPAIERDVYSILGRQVAVGAVSADVRATIGRVLRGFGPVASLDDAALLPRYDLTAVEQGWVMSVDGAVVASGEFKSALSALEAALVTEAVTRHRELFHVHGAALCLPTERRGLVLAGDSANGKTTLALGMMLRGFVPFSDDIVLVDPDTLGLRPLRRAFHTNDSTWKLLAPLAGGALTGDDDAPGYFVPPQWAENSVPVRWVIFPEYRPHQVPQLIPLSPGVAATAILTRSGTLTRDPRLALSAARRMTEQAPCYRFLTGDLSESVTALQRLVLAPRA